ncbi:hypothetical protein [Ornithinibacillus scapharcae]|uniref:hypothetical protein n=1 Tax=Ornithinibacillus scapharcae TaxID=1147159 RepID=UPI000225AE71|nr:hypothetical protein [Ornithinibacillus scapharcae]
MNRNPLEKLMWSVALPGFGQLLNRKYFKGIILITLELLINVLGNLNNAILLSFHGNIADAIAIANYNWLLFYPCVYSFAMWDAMKDAGGGEYPYSFLPFVLSAFSATVGLVYSSKLTILGVLLGPVWLPILFFFPGMAVGLLVKKILMNAFPVSSE